MGVRALKKKFITGPKSPNKFLECKNKVSLLDCDVTIPVALRSSYEKTTIIRPLTQKKF